jgi:hypothetical protein
MKPPASHESRLSPQECRPSYRRLWLLAVAVGLSPTSYLVARAVLGVHEEDPLHICRLAAMFVGIAIARWTIEGLLVTLSTRFPLLCVSLVVIFAMSVATPMLFERQ